MKSIGSVMRENEGVGPGFDFLRLWLALSVVAFHAVQLTKGKEWVIAQSGGPLDLYVSYIIPAFFALSGFLVAGSMLRLAKVQIFLLFRALRIFPALLVEITLSALILGPIVTSLPLDQYFRAPEFHRYFTNVLGIIRFQLPGVFLDNPVSNIVNGQLWTIPGELRCYIALALLMIVRLSTGRWLMVAVFLAAAGGECAIGLLPGRHYTAGTLQSLEALVLSFLAGNALYLIRDVVPVRPWLLLLAIAGCVVAYLVPIMALLLGTVSISYVIAYLGLCRIPRIPVLQRGDYSYGIYLYSFPLQQTAVWAFPALREWYWNLLLGGLPAIGFAMLSWHFLEKPALGLRKFFVPKRRPDIVTARPALDPDDARVEPGSSFEGVVGEPSP
jgi:peptidoglycan/LPS O-acetylase OafA/YrhL